MTPRWQEVIKPPNLEPWQFIAVVAPSDCVSPTDIWNSVQFVEKNWGCNVVLGPNLLKRDGDFAAGSPNERFDDIMWAFENPKVGAVIAAEGGYAAMGMMHLFRNELDFFRKNPKWMMGYSDANVVSHVLDAAGVMNITGPNFSWLYRWANESHVAVRNILFEGKLPQIDENEKWETLSEGRKIIEARLIASNLDTLIYSTGTWADPLNAVEGNIALVVEEVDVEPSVVFRGLHSIVLNHVRSDDIKVVGIGKIANWKEMSYVQWAQENPPEKLMKELFDGACIPAALMGFFGHAEPEDAWGQTFTSIVNLAPVEIMINGMCRLRYTE